MKKDITALFCFVDDFCKISEQWINKSFLPLINKNPTRKPEISYSELLTESSIINLSGFNSPKLCFVIS